VGGIGDWILLALVGRVRGLPWLTGHLHRYFATAKQKKEQDT